MRCARLLLAVEDLIQYPMIKNQWLELYDQIRQYPIHYQRKQNQLYPLLEKKGFDRPTTTMWNFDDIIRDEIKESLRLLEANDEEAFIAAQSELIANARDLMEKEETILYPTSYALISAEEFEDMKAGDQEIGFAFFKVDNHHHPTPTILHLKKALQKTSKPFSVSMATRQDHSRSWMWQQVSLP